VPDPKSAKLVLIAICLFASGNSAAVDPERQFFQYDFFYPTDQVDFPTEIFDVEEDRDGFLWFATARGLIRYDGLETTLYRVSSYPELQSNEPRRLFIDSDNRLIIASVRGLSLYVNGEFIALARGETWAAQIHAIDEDANGVVWLASDDGLWQLDGLTLSEVQADVPVDDLRSALWHGDRLYTGGRGQVFVMADNALTSIISLPSPLSGAFVRDLEFHRGRIWGATRYGLFRIDNGVAEHVQIDDVEGAGADVLLSDQDQNLWFAGRTLLGRFRPDDTLELPSVSDSEFGYLPEITELFEDSLGQHWHTSRFFGVSMLRDTPVRRVSFSEGLLSPTVTAIAADAAGDIYIASDKGVSKVSGNNIDALLTGDFSPGNTIHALHVDRDEYLWLGTDTGVRRFSLTENDWDTSVTAVDPGVRVNTFSASDDGGLWMGTENGLVHADENSLSTNNNTEALNVRSLFQDSQGTLWLGTDSGIARINNGALEPQPLDNVGDTASVIAFAELPSGSIVAVSPDRGLAVFDRNHWRIIGEREGLPPEELIDIEVAGQYIWLFTSAGIFRSKWQDIDTPPVDNLHFEAVVTASSEYRATFDTLCCRGDGAATALLAKDFVHSATGDGVIILNQNVTTRTSAMPRPYIKSVSVAGETVDLGNGDPGNEIVVQAGSSDDRIQIDYSAVQLGDGDRVVFRYRVLGLGSEEWISVEQARSVLLQNFPPDTFRFELQASIDEQNWSDSPVGFAFERQARFSETAASRLLAWAAAVLAGVAVIWLSMANRRRRHQQLEISIRERTEALSAVNKELEVANQDLERASQTDPLTGLVNRRFLDSRLSRKQLDNLMDADSVMMMIDIDYFKRVNDAYGHPVGDDVLCQFAEVLRTVTRQSDLVARWGGEEFLIICRCPNGDPKLALDRLLGAISNHRFHLSGESFCEITCSIGAVGYPLWRGADAHNKMPLLLELADAALYAVKVHGRDGWALLRGGKMPATILPARRAGSELQSLVEREHLIWSSSREAISPSMDDTVTRIRAISVP